MRTLVLEIDDDIFERVIAFLKILPENKMRVISDREHIPFVSEEEQCDIEELLKDRECFETEYKVTVEL